MKVRGKDVDWFALWSNYCEGLDSSCSAAYHPLVYCPYHDNRHSPAFQINLTRPLVHCFSGCGISGSYEHAICVLEGIYEKNGITEADLARARQKREPEESKEIKRSRWKVQRAHGEGRKLLFKYATGPSREKIKLTKHDAKPEKVQIDEKQLNNYTYVPKEAVKYLEQRGINAESRRRFELGFDDSVDRITIPVRDDRARLSFIIRRALHSDQRPKYLYPEGSAKNRLLFGACNLDLAQVDSDGLILVEGPLDAIRLHQAGYRNTVALLGSSLSEDQRKLIERLRPKRIYLFFDQDASGIHAIERIGNLLVQKNQVRVCLYPRGTRNLDPASLSNEQVGRAINKAIALRGVLQRMKTKRSVTTV